MYSSSALGRNASKSSCSLRECKRQHSVYDGRFEWLDKGKIWVNGSVERSTWLHLELPQSGLPAPSSQKEASFLLPFLLAPWPRACSTLSWKDWDVNFEQTPWLTMERRQGLGIFPYFPRSVQRWRAVPCWRQGAFLWLDDARGPFYVL